jgi:hypothetical protein
MSRITKTKTLFAIILAVMICATSIVPAFATTSTCPGNASIHTADNCSYTEISTKAATCKETGYTTYACTTCASEFVVSIPKLTSHQYTETVIESTCIRTGRVTKLCSVCGDYSVTETDALGHNWTYVWDEKAENPTACDGTSKYESRTCTRCFTVEKNGIADTHKWELTNVVVEPTCMTEGKAIYACATCNKTVESVIAKLPGHGTACVKVGTISKATCTTDGIARYNCSICNKTFDAVDPTDLKRHGTAGWDEVTKAVAQGCTTDRVLGTDKYCKLCNALCKSTGVAYTEDELKANAAKHTWTETITPATCISTGLKRRVCTCGLVETEIIPATGHTEKVIAGTLATCKVEGTTYGVICATCGVTIKAVEKVPTIAHVYKEDSRVWTTAITTPTDKVHCGGVLKITSKCSCGDTIIDYITYPEHEFTATKVTEPTCKDKGYTEYVCKFCEAVDTSREAFDETAINADNHKLPELGKGIAIGIGATCTEAGREIAKCELGCGYETVREVPVRGHAFAEIDAEYMTNDELAAKYGTLVVRVANTGTCLVQTQYKLTCANCDETKIVSVEDGTGKGHVKNLENGYTAALAPTCETPGSTEGYVCANDKWCTYAVAKKDIPAIHLDIENGMIKVDEVKATCSADGNIEYYICPNGVDCSKYNEETKLPYMCDKNLVTVTDTVAKQLTHQPVKGLLNAVTCSDYGYRANICNLCDEYIETTNFTATIAHTYAGETVLESCSDGRLFVKTCTICDYVDVVADPTRPAGHIVTYNGVTNKLTSSCGDANTIRVCSACENVITKDEHTFETPVLVDNTLKYTCIACGATKIVEHVEHDFVDGKCICGVEAPVDTTVDTEAPETEAPIESETETEAPVEDTGFEMTDTYWVLLVVVIIAFATVALFLVANKKRKD